MNNLYSNSPMTQSNVPQPITSEDLQRLKELPERIIMDEPMYIVSPGNYKYLEDNGHVKDGKLTKKGHNLLFG